MGNQLLPLNIEIVKDAELRISSKNYAYIMEQSDRIICVEPQSINKKCVQIPYGILEDKVCIIPLVSIQSKQIKLQYGKLYASLYK